MLNWVTTMLTNTDYVWLFYRGNGDHVVVYRVLGGYDGLRYFADVFDIVTKLRVY